VVVRARVSGGPETEESRWIPPPPFPGENREENRAKSWGKTIKMALAGVAIAGASLVAPRRAHALPDAVVNGGMAAAGATAASILLKTAVGRGNSAAALAPPATAATVAEALVVAAEEASSSSSSSSSSTSAIISPPSSKSPMISTKSSPSSAVVALAAGLEGSGSDASPVINVKEVEVVKEVKTPAEEMTRQELAALIVRETPAWQVGLAAAAPCAALLAVVLAARRFASAEIAKAREELLTDHEQELAERLEDAEKKLAAMIKEHASAAKEREALEKKATELETKMNQRATFEMEKLEAKFMMREAEQAREVEEAREALAAVVKEKELLAQKIEAQAKSEADAAIAEVESRWKSEMGAADAAAAEKLEAAQSAARAELETVEKALKAELETVEKASAEKLEAANAELAAARNEIESAEKAAEEMLEASDKAAAEELERARADLLAKLEAAERAAAEKLEAVQKDLDAARSDDAKKLEEAYQLKTETLEKYKAAADEELTRAKADLEKALGDTSTLEKYKAAADEELTRAKADLEKALGDTSTLEKYKAAADEELTRAKADLEKALGETSTLRAELMDAKSAAETVRETMMKEADELRAKYEGELQGAEKAKAELEAWRKDREEWEKTTKENFLAMEKELKETKSKLEATEEEAVKAADESDVEAMKKIEAIRDELETEVAIASDRLQEMEGVMRAAQQARADAEKELSDVRQDMDVLKQMMDDTSRDAVQQNLDMEQELGRVMNEANELRAKLDAQAKALEARDGDAFKALEKASGETAALKADLEAANAAAAADAALRADLEQAMVRAHEIAKENAIKMVKHNERMGRWRSYKSGDIDIPVKFEIAVETLPGQRVAMVGTWNDWDISAAFPMVWTEGNVWTVTTPIHADDTYEYKYVVIDGEGPAALENATWQSGNNRALGLNLSLHDEVALVEVVDTWRPDPKQAPVILHMVDGTVKEEGSTKLLHDVVRELRTEQALLDGSLNVKVLAEIARAISAAAGDSIADPLDEEFFDAMERAAVEEAAPPKPPKDIFTTASSNIVAAEEAEEHVPVFVDAEEDFAPDGDVEASAMVNVNVTADGEQIAESTMADVDVGEEQDASAGPR